jgi:hypothetical protein
LQNFRVGDWWWLIHKYASFQVFQCSPQKTSTLPDLQMLSPSKLVLSWRCSTNRGRSAPLWGHARQGRARLWNSPEGSWSSVGAPREIERAWEIAPFFWAL